MNEATVTQVHDGPAERLRRASAIHPSIVWVLTAVVISGALLTGLFLIGWTPQTRRKAALAAEAEVVKNAAPRVAVVAPKRSAASSEIMLTGQIQAVRETTIYARTSGYLKKWMVDIGDKVKTGQLLGEIESPEIDLQLERSLSTLIQTKAALEQTAAALKQAQAQLENAKASAALTDLTLERYVSLRSSHSVTEQDISEKETAAKVAHTAVNADEAAIVAAQANINAAKANVEAAESDVRRLRVLKSFELITAPFDGTISSRNIEVGSLITEGSGSTAQPLFHVICTDPVRVFVDVPQTYAPAIKVDQEVQLLVREFPGTPRTGKVARTAGALDTASRTLRTEVHVPNADGQLLSGMYAQVKINVQHQHPPLLLPNAVLIVNADGNQVALVRDGHIHFQKVELEGDYGAEFAFSGGLEDTDAVVANPSDRLTEGMAVDVVTPQK